MTPVGDQETLTGRAFIGEDFLLRDVAITVEHGRITAIEETAGAGGPWICPCFFNAHTHLADTIALDIPAGGDLASLVAPPDGLKHRILRAAPAADLMSGMRRSIEVMHASGTAGFADFREGGPEGVALLREALKNAPCRGVIFGRDGGERHADGLGIAHYRPGAGIEAAVAEARRQGKRIAIHAAEKDAGDLDAALELQPDLLVHCTHATGGQLRRIADEEIPVAVCPRSNWALGVAASPDHPPIARMLELGCRLLLGTDNVMFVQPDMTAEMAFVSLVYRIPARDVLRMAVAGSALFGEPHDIREGNMAAFVCVDPMRGNLRFSRDPLATFVKRVNASLIERIIYSMP
ncbi:MAG: amidohydrolase family protein [Methanomicrobiales archaeon]|nr:amidohydrolase family protein [Methanomicrobiales archaeon]